jgi:hypothetical protein
MARKPLSATDELATLRQQVSAERVRHGEAQAAKDAADAAVQGANAAITLGYAKDDRAAVADARNAEAEAVATVDDLAHQLAAADLRLERAQRDLAGFLAARGRDLIQEREPDAVHAADHLVDTVHAAVRAYRKYRDVRTEVDALVSNLPGAVVRVDGTPSTFEWEAALRTLDRVVREHPEPPPPPMPQWNGLRHQELQNASAQHLRDQRQAKVKVA